MRRALVLASAGATASASAVTLTRVEPSAVGLHGGARLYIRGSNLPSNPDILIGGQPCAHIRGRSDPRNGEWTVCWLPPQPAPGNYGVTVGGVGCAECSVSYEDDLTAAAWVTHDTKAGPLVFAAGDHIPLALHGNLELLSSFEQVRSRVRPPKIPTR